MPASVYEPLRTSNDDYSPRDSSDSLRALERSGRTRSHCATCSQPAKYTCPKCSARSCSLACSTTHKARTQCSGERNKAAFVPMNEYGWGTMMNDYAYLEGLGRKVGDWGNEIARGKFQARGRGRGRGRGGAQSTGRSKRDVLKLQLEQMEIEMDVLPTGMERSKQNQSAWDFRNRSAQLTIEFIFHRPINPLVQQPESSFTLLTHRNTLTTPLLAILQKHISERKLVPGWVAALVCPDADAREEFTAPQCVMRARTDPLLGQMGAHHRLDPAYDLGTLLRHTHFVEYPTIEVWEEFRGQVVDAVGTVTQEAERAPKRRKVDKKAGGLAISSLLDGYGSEEEEPVAKPDGMDMLGGYLGSDDGQDSDDGVELDPATLLELVRKVRGDENWTANMREEDEDVDWGESD